LYGETARFRTNALVARINGKAGELPHSAKWTRGQAMHMNIEAMPMRNGLVHMNIEAATMRNGRLRMKMEAMTMCHARLRMTTEAMTMCNGPLRMTTEAKSMRSGQLRMPKGRLRMHIRPLHMSDEPRIMSKNAVGTLPVLVALDRVSRWIRRRMKLKRAATA
jgi:hypothetical protein